MSLELHESAFLTMRKQCSESRSRRDDVRLTGCEILLSRAKATCSKGQEQLHTRVCF